MVQFEVPAIVPADPDANVADLLAKRVEATPDRALFSVPQGDGWRDITAADFETAVIALARGSPLPASSPARRWASSPAPRTSGASSTSRSSMPVP